MCTTGELEAPNGQDAALERAKTEADQEMKNELMALRDKNAALDAELKSVKTSVDSGANGSAMGVGVPIFRDEDQSPEALLARIAHDQPHNFARRTCLFGLIPQPFKDPHVEAAFQATYVCMRA